MFGGEFTRMGRVGAFSKAEKADETARITEEAEYIFKNKITIEGAEKI